MQIVRAAIYKEIKGYDYRELEFAQIDSRICATFIKLDERQPFCFQTFQKYISRISEDTLHKVLVEIVKIAVEEGYEDISKIRQDSTVVKSNIHYPTNNALVWDCIKESHRLLSHLKEEVGTFSFIDYTNSAKSNLIIDCHIPKGNPSDRILFTPTLDRVIENYGIIPRDSSTDGGYANKENSNYCESKGLVNIVFNKVVGSLQNIATSLKMETMLKKWRSGIEGVISNLKRGFDLRVCAWKGFEHFKSKVM